MAVIENLRPGVWKFECTPLWRAESNFVTYRKWNGQKWFNNCPDEYAALNTTFSVLSPQEYEDRVQRAISVTFVFDLNGKIGADPFVPTQLDLFQ